MATKKKPVVQDFEISPPLKLDKTWSYKWNDERVTYEQYVQLCKDQEAWVKEQASKEEYIPPKKKRK